MTKTPHTKTLLRHGARGWLQAPWRLLRSTELGQGLVEYALIIAVVAVGSIVSLTFMKDSLTGLFSRTASGLSAGATSGPPPPAPPVPEITTGPAQPNTTATTAVFDFTGVTGAAFECKLDTGAFEDCTSPHAYTGPLATGDHTFEVQATNANGTSLPASYAWTIGVTPAAPQITSGPNQPNTTATNADFEFTAAGGATVECKLDGAAFADCDSSTTQGYTGIATGTHTFQVRASNAFGTGTAASYDWTIGVAPAAPTITSGPSQNTTATSASFVFGAAGGGTLECKLDGAAFANCASSTTQGYSGLASGAHTFQVRATNPFGTSAADSYSWTIGTAPATPTITSGPSQNTTATSASFVFSAAGGATLECKLDGAAFANCATSTTQGYSGLASGAHTFQVRAANVFGTSSADSYNWTIGTAPAAPNISSGPGSSTTATNASFVFSAAGGATVQCKLDGAAFANCATSTTQSYTGLATGAHTFQVQATNAFGTSSPATYTWTITVPGPTGGSVVITPSSNVDDGDVLTATNSGWSPTPTGYTYQWQIGDDTSNGNVQTNCTSSSGGALTWADFGSPVTQAGATRSVTTSSFSGASSGNDRCYRVIVVATNGSASSAALTSAARFVDNSN